jgi:DNA invertase Pin-like site-specific DNA recombinase
MKAIVYCRYSARPKRRKIDEAETLEVQESYCRRYFEFHGIEIGRVIADPQTSARLVPLHKRKGGQELLALTTGKAPAYSIVGAYRLDRLFRDVVDGILTLRAWERAGTAAHFTAQGGQSLNTETATGRYIVNILLSTAAHEADLTSERTRQADAAHQANGRIVGGLPYGWRRDPIETTKMIPNADEQLVLLKMLELAGDNFRLANPRAVARALNALGYRTRKGTPWHHEAVRRIVNKPRLA